METKKCNSCSIVKKLNRFFKRKDSKDGYRNICIECRKTGKKENKLEVFKIKAIKVHGYEFDYTYSNYVDAHTKIKIKCKKHGIFEQTPNRHLSGAKCTKCSKRMSQEEFLEKANKKHLTGYNFKNTVYLEYYKKVEALCNIHGVFITTPHKIFTTKNPCKICSKKLRIKTKTRKTLETIKKDFIKTHGKRYIYDKCIWIKNGIKLIIGCRIHGYFEQGYESHKRGSGCPKCAVKTASRKKTKMTKEVKILSQRVRSRIRKYIKKMGNMKSQRTIETLGCNFNFLKNYLEDNEYGFRLDNKNIDLDHKIPLSEANSEEELIQLCHYTNLQLLPSYYNRNVKRAKELDNNRLKKWLKNNDKNLWGNKRN